jgi:hypothetical protein
MSVGLSIMFTGLCALVSDGDGKPGQVLLLDTQGVGQVQGVTLPVHAPTLVVSLNELANPENSGPTRVVAGAPGAGGRVDQLGLWDLAGSEVRIRVQGGAGPGVRYFRPGRQDTSWPAPPRDPHDPAAWRDLRFVPDMTALAGDGRIDPSLLDDAAGGLPRAVAARVHLDGGRLEAAIPSQQSYRDDVFEFKRAGSAPGVRQAMTDTMHWRLQTDAAAVVIEIVPVAGGRPKQLLLGPSARPHRVFISNLPADNAPHAEAHGAALTDEQMIALHFGVYYALLRTEPADKPLPELWQAPRGARGAGAIRPKFCSAAIFSRR